MKLKLVILCLLTVILGLATTVVSAQENNPLVNEDANACFEGGAFYDMCDKLDVDDDGDADSFDSEWCWNCGWYFIRVEYKMFPEDVLDGVCRDIPPVVVVEEDEDDDKDKDKDKDEEDEDTDIPDLGTPTE